MATQSAGPTHVKSSPSNFRSKAAPPSNIVTAPSKSVVKEPPPLFPPNPLLDELPKPNTTSDVYLLRKSVSIKQLFRSSPFFLQPQQKTKDIERYSDKYHTKESSLDMNNVIVASSGMFPSELISEKDKKIARANLLKRKVPDTTPHPIPADPILDQTKKGKKKAETKKTAKTTKRKKGSSEIETESRTTSKAKGTTKAKSKKGKEIGATTTVEEKETPVRLSKLAHTILPEMDLQALQKLEEQEAKETEDIDDDQELSNKKRKKIDVEDEDNEQQMDLEEDENLLDDEDYNTLIQNDDVEDDYNDAGGSDGEAYMD